MVGVLLSSFSVRKQKVFDREEIAKTLPLGIGYALT